MKNELTSAQSELLEWIKDYVRDFQHSPSIRQMMKGMDLKSPAPIQSRLKHLQEKGFICWQEGKARTLQLVDNLVANVPVLGSVAAGGLIETFDDTKEEFDISEILKRKNVYALHVNGDSMIDAFIAHGDMVLMEPVNDLLNLRNGDIVCAMVPGLGTTLKYYRRNGDKIILDPANDLYDPIILQINEVSIQGKLLAVWRTANKY